jgi:hypothetical protein
MPTVRFELGEMPPAVKGDVPELIADRLMARAGDAKSAVAYQVAINIQARVEGSINSPVPLRTVEERDELWEVVNPLRAERPADQWLARLWDELFSARLADHGATELIQAEIERIGADRMSVGQKDAIGYKDFGDGYGQLGGSPRAEPDLYWNGRSEDILRRLISLPAGSGPEAIKSEFHT